MRGGAGIANSARGVRGDSARIAVSVWLDAARCGGKEASRVPSNLSGVLLLVLMCRESREGGD